MIRNELCVAIKAFKIDNNLSYNDLSLLTNLNKTQLNNIVNNNGAEVKLEKIEDAIYKCGMLVKFNVVNASCESLS